MLMSTIHPLSGEDSLVLRMRKHLGNKSTNASGANSTFLPGECQKELDIPVIVDAYNKQRWVWMWLTGIKPILIHSLYPDAICIHCSIGFWRQFSSIAL